MELGRLLVFGCVILQNSLNTIADDGEKDKTSKYNCFRESNEEKCEDTRVKISDDFYVCDLVVQLDTPPKRVGHEDGNILFSSGGRTFKINSQSRPEMVGTIIPPGETSDHNGNVYYDGYGTSFAVEKNTGREIEIITSGENSINQHVLDVKGKMIFILSFDLAGDNNYRTGRLYSTSTDPLNVYSDKVQAKIISGVSNSITSLAVDTSQEFLLLGIKEDTRGKLIRLKREKFDPCSKQQSTRAAVMDFIKSIGDKLLQLIESSPDQSEAQFKINIEENLKTLMRENFQLRREVKLTREKLTLISSKLVGLPSFSAPPPPSYSRPATREPVNNGPSGFGYASSSSAGSNYPPSTFASQNYPQPQTIGGFSGNVAPFVPYRESSGGSGFLGSRPDNFGVPYSCLPKNELEELYFKINESASQKMDAIFTVSEILRDLENVGNTDA